VPTYDYECTKCGYTFATEQSMLDEPLKRCPKCRGKLEKLPPQTVNLIFKGSGFYVTDYKRSVKDKAARSEAEDKSPERPSDLPKKGRG
jgi:putative FmdB family regulatory protein